MFILNKTFVNLYKSKKPPFGFNGLGELVYKRTYSRLKEDGTNESWYETVRRVVEGTYRMQERRVTDNRLGWEPKKAQRSAQEMYDKIFNMKFLPPGRGLWAMGSAITEERHLYSALNNCAFVSTENLKEDKSKPFCFLMDMSMLGVGVGFDTKGAMRLTVNKPTSWTEPIPEEDPVYIIPDSREGWVESLERLLNSYFEPNMPPISFNYSLLRPKGAPIKGFGGKSSGPKPLREMHVFIRSLLDERVGKRLTVSNIVDIMNYIGRCVVAGNVRRSAEIAFGDPRDEEFLDLKNPELNGDKIKSHRWASNNTVFAELGMKYGNVAAKTRKNGEPGYAWLSNMQAYGRMKDLPDWKDKRAKGGNPCLEQTLESYELCCLVEVFPDRCDSYEDFERTLKFAYLYAKTVTLGASHWSDTNRVMLRNRRIGCSMSGIVQFLSSRGIGTFHEWCNKGYAYLRKLDKMYAEWFCIPESIKITSVKPSGSVSKLPGATSGIHWPTSRYCKLRVSVSSNHGILEDIRKAGYVTEINHYDPTSEVIEFPVDYGDKLRPEAKVSMWEKLNLAAFMQREWADNQVSATITFDQKTEGMDIEKALEYYQYQLKGVSFLPMTPEGEDSPFTQMPYEPITKKEYDKMVSKIKPIVWTSHKDAESERFCDSDVCQIKS